MKLRTKFLALCILLASRSSLAIDMSLNGFGSAYLGQAFSSELLPLYFTDQHVNFTRFSLIGLNVGSKVGDHFGAAMQIVGLGSSFGNADRFALLAQWAYFTYDSGNGTFIKAGRQLLPFYIASEYVRVAFLTPFRRIPSPVGDLAPFTRFDGISISQRFDFEVGKLTVGIHGGSPLADISPSSLQGGVDLLLADLLGGHINWDGEGYRIRASASRCLNQISVPAKNPLGQVSYSIFNGHTQVFSLGYRVDKNNIVSWGEYAFARTPDGTPYPFKGDHYAGNSHLYYWLGGYRIGKFLPRYTFAQGSSTYGIVDANETTHTVGLNYQIDPQAVIKAEYERVIVPEPGASNSIVTQPNGTTATSGDAAYIGVDFIF